MHPAQLPTEELLKACEFRRGRRSGPGGQHRNKVETAVTVTHKPTGLQGDASERRSQADNRRMAIFRLRVRLAIQHRESAADDRSELWRNRCPRGKVNVSDSHTDFPSLLAEALDVLSGTNWDDVQAAERLGLSRSQLTRFLKMEPNALKQLNEHRAAAGRSPLR